MRTLNPTLQAAMDSGNFSPIVRAAILDPDDHSVIQYLDVIYFKISGTEIDIEFYDVNNTYTDVVSLERGAKIGNTEYTIFTGIYHLTSTYKVQGGLYVCSGSLIEPRSVSLLGDTSYQSVIYAILGLGENVAAFKTPGAAWLGYTFMPSGQSFHSNNIHSFLALLKQKYLIHVTENGLTTAPAENSLLFFSAQDSLALASQYTITLTAQDTFSNHIEYRQFIWRDETGLEHAPGPDSYQIHNLGYLESTASAPNIPGSILEIADTVVTVIPNLKYQTGDCVKFDPVRAGYTPVKSILDVTEIFDARSEKGTNKPAWYMELRPLPYFANSAGGTIPVSSQYTAAYTGLVTHGFNGLLSDNVNNLQAFADAVDDLNVPTYSGGGDLDFILAHDYTVTIPGTGTVAMLNQSNVFSGVSDPLTTPAESWIGPSNTTGIYFKNGNRGFGTTNPNAVIDIQGSSAYASLNIAATNTGASTSSLLGAGIQTYFNPAGASLTNLYGSIFQPTMSGSSITVATAYAAFYRMIMAAGFTGTITSLYTARFYTPTLHANNSITRAVGVAIDDITGSTGVDTNLLIGGSSIPAGQYSIYNYSTRNNYFAGNFGVGTSPGATVKLGVAMNTADPSSLIYGNYAINTGTFSTTIGANAVTVGQYGEARVDLGGYDATGTLPVRGGMFVGRVTGTTGNVTNVAATVGQIMNNAALSSSIITNAYSFFAYVPLSWGANAITNWYGFHVAAHTIGSSSIVAFSGAIAASTGRWNLYMSGTAQNYLAGNLGIGVTAPTARLDVVGNADISQLTVTGYSTQSGALANYNRNDTAAGISRMLILTNLGSQTNGDGSSILMRGKDSSSAGTYMAEISWTFVDVTHATRKSRLTLSAYDGSLREGLRIEASGSAPMIGFFGANAVVQQTGCAEPSDLATVITAIKALRTALNAYGLTTVV